jgi:hypothetical protein
MASYSWRKAGRAAAITAVIVLVIGLAVGVSVARDPHAVGELTGRCMMLCAAFAYAMSYLLQTGRKRIAIGAVVLVGALVVAGAIGVSLDRTHGFSAADRVPLVVDGDRLRHPTLGFSIANPGPGFHEDATQAKGMYDAFKVQDAPVYAYAGPGNPPSAVLMVMVDNYGGDDLSHNLDGFEQGVRESAGEQKLTVTTVDKHATADEATVHVVVGPVHMRMHAYARNPANHAAIEVTVLVVSRDEHELQGVLDSVR